MPDTVSLKGHLREATALWHRRLANDLNAVAEGKENANPGGVAHPALHIVAECAAVNGMIAGYLSGGEFNRPTPEQREAHLRSFDTREKALAYLEQETQRLLSTIDGLDESTLGEVSDAPLGRPMTRFALAELPAQHMAYHDGQIGYIHLLHGDNKNHWG